MDGRVKINALLLGVVLLVITTGFIAVSLTRTASEALLFDPSNAVGYYQGWGWTNEDGIFGKQFYQVDIKEDGFGTTKILIDQNNPTLGHFTSFFPNGDVRARGTCIVEYPTMHVGQPAPNVLKPIQGDYYDTQGREVSIVRDGNGEIVLYDSSGIKRLKAKMAGGQWTAVQKWDAQGNLAEEANYENGQPSGPFKEFFPSGQIRVAGQFRQGRMVGQWKTYDEDGNLISSKQH